MSSSLFCFLVERFLVLSLNAQNGSIFGGIVHKALRRLYKVQGILTAHFREDKWEVRHIIALAI
jgi:hypothetical protein